MTTYEVRFHNKAIKQIPNLKVAKLDKRVLEIAKILEINPYQNPPPYEKLVGNLNGKYSRRLNIQHRLVYQVNEQAKTVDILSMWTHYE